MQKVNTNDVPEVAWTSPNGKFGGAGKQISEALGRQPLSMDINQRHPFDVELMRLAPGKLPYPYHSHSAQWEFYLVVSGIGFVRHDGGKTAIGPGDAFVFKPGEAHVLGNDGSQDLLVYVIADNPVGESCHYPDSGKWLVRSPERRLMRSEALDYFDGEE